MPSSNSRAVRVRGGGRKVSGIVLRIVALTILVAATRTSSAAAIIWTGSPITFTNVAGSDATVAANQDRLTPNVWITRSGSQGIYNAKTEIGFSHTLSPADTTWANGTTANFASLTYTDWNTWARGVNQSPPATVGVD